MLLVRRLLHFPRGGFLYLVAKPKSPRGMILGELNGGGSSLGETLGISGKHQPPPWGWLLSLTPYPPQSPSVEGVQQTRPLSLPPGGPTIKQGPNLQPKLT